MRVLGIGPKQPSLAHFWYVESSSYEQPVPLVYGQMRVSGMLMHMPSQPVKASGGKGGIKGTKGSSMYNAPVIIGICEGPIVGLGYIWADKNMPEDWTTGHIQNQSNENDTVPNAGPFTILVGLASHWISDVSVYDQTSGTWLQRLLPDSGAPSPAAGQYQLDGTGNGKYYFNAAQANHSVWITYFYWTGGKSFPGNWTLKLGTTPTQAVWSGLAGYPGQGVTYPGIAYMAHPNANFPADNAQQFSYEVKGLNQFGGGILDANGADILNDFLTNSLHGANFPAASLGILSGNAGSYYNYCAAAGLFSSPVYNAQQPAHQHLAELFEVTNSAPYWSDGLLKVVPFGDTALTANGYTYTPNVTPLYALTDIDFQPSSGGDLDPVRIVRKDPSTVPNKVKVEYTNRAFDYNTDFVVAEDQVSQAANGPLELAPLSLRSVTSQSVARTVAQLRLRREKLVSPVSYEFVLGWKYSALEPMDLIKITDTAQGLNATTVRIVSVEEQADEQGFTVIAEPWPLGVANAVLYPVPGGAGARPTTNALPGDTAAPFIIEAPVPLATSAMDLWIGASGGANWGGCNIWISTDNVNFVQALSAAGTPAQCLGTAAFGTLQPNGLPGTSPQWPTVDNVHTMSATVTTGRQLVSLSATDFARLTYPVVVSGNSDTEWLEYTAAALVSGTQYNLTALYRGLYGTAPQAHVAADVFMMIDNTVARVAFPQGVQGTTIYLKLPAFNLYGAQLQNLADIGSFTYVLGGYPIARSGSAMIVTLRLVSSANGSAVIVVTVIDPLNEPGNCTLAVTCGGLISLLDPTSVNIYPAGGSLGGIVFGQEYQYTVTFNRAFHGTGYVKFRATAANTGRLDGYATWSVPQADQMAEPSIVITFLNNNSTTDPTAKGSAVVNTPDNISAGSIKWNSSKTAYPAVGTGTTINGPSPFVIADLGFNFALGESVYLTITQYDAVGTQGLPIYAKATRENLNIQKTATFNVGELVPFDSGLLNWVVPSGVSTGSLGLKTGIVTNARPQWGVRFTVPANATITSCAFDAYWSSGLPQSGVTVYVDRLTGSGGSTSLGNASASNVGWQTLTIGLAELASVGNSYRGSFQFLCPSSTTDTAAGQISVTYTMPDTTVSI